MESRKLESFKPEHIVLTKSEYPVDWNEDIVETAGFIPLEVRFKQMEQAGFRAQFFENEFSSKDVTDMYLNHPEFDITGEDDIEEAYEKMQLRAAYINSVKEEIARRKQEAAESEHAATDSRKSESEAKATSRESAAGSD